MIFFSQNLCREWIDFLLSDEMYPVCDPISKGITFTVYVWMSEIKCWYFWNLSSCADLIRCSAGIVSSKMVTVLFDFSTITISGLSVVTTRLGGMVPPADV